MTPRDKVRAKERAQHRTDVLNRFKRIKGCVDCGYRANCDGLQFDHRPGTDGVKNVSSLVYSSWDVIKREMAKCDVRCCNCHSIRTHERRRAAVAELADAQGREPCG